MKKERIDEIKLEAEKRLKLWLENSNFNEMSVFGSPIRFNMSIGLLGYSFEKESWMAENEFNKFINDKEFYSDEVDIILDDLFQIALNESYNNNC